MFIKKPWILISLILISLFISIFVSIYNDSKLIKIEPLSIQVEKMVENKITEIVSYPEDTDFFICKIENSEKESFCRFSFYLSKDIKKGKDLSSYQYISFNIENMNNYLEDSFNIYLMNFSEEYSSEYDIESLKKNSIFLNQTNKLSYKDIPLSNFHVTDRWIEEYNIPYNKSYMDLSNISLIQIQTGTNTPKGEYKIQIKNISFKGKWINEKHLFLFLIAKWILISLTYLLVFLYREMKRANLFEIKNIKLKTSTKQILEDSKKDPLTGIYNRHAFRHWISLRKKEMKLSIIYMDLDYFKKINDTYGHTMGDEILCQFTDVVSSKLTDNEIFCRWGGEEFIIFIKNGNEEDSKRLIKLIQKELEKVKWKHGREVTISAGIALGTTKNPCSGIECADKALYKAKNSGRNCYKMFK